MRVQVYITALFFVFSTANTQAQEQCDFHFFDRQNLQSLAQAGSIETLSQLLHQSPNCFKANQVSVYKSHSLHCANYKAPRIIIYANDEVSGNTICSFNSGLKSDYAEFYADASDRDCHENAMECQTFNPASKRFEYFQVTVPKDEQGQYFSTSVKKMVISEVNPTTCLTCHRGNTPFLGSPNPRPNLENYPTWPGMYGSLHDKFASTPSEKNHYIIDYLTNRDKNPRYSALPIPVDTATMTYTGNNSKPIVNLQNFLESQNQKRIASEFTDPQLLAKAKPFRYAILAALACSDEIKTSDVMGNQIPPRWKYGIETFIPEKLKARFQTTYTAFATEAFRLHKKNIQSLYDTQKLAGSFESDQFENQYQTDIKVDPFSPIKSWQLSSDTSSNFWLSTRLAYLGFNLGLPVWDWSLTFQSTLSFEAGRHNFSQLYPLFADALLDKQADADVYLKDPYLFRTTAGDAYCDKLQAKSLAALSPFEDKTVDFRFIPSNGVKPSGGVFSSSSGSSNIRNAPPALQYCISCHVTGSAIPIPFNDAGKLRADLFSPASTHSNNLLIDEIVQRIDSGSMPKHIPISDAEKTDLKDYFLSVFTN